MISLLLFVTYVADSKAYVFLSEVKTTNIQVLTADGIAEDDVMACDILATRMTDLLVRDLDGNVITQTRSGSQVLLEMTSINECDQNKPLLVILEIRQSNGLTIFLAWQDSTIGAGESAITGISWLAPEPGQYEVRADCLRCIPPLPIETIKIREFSVLP